MTASTLVFIDATLDDYQHLAQGVVPDAQVVVLDSRQDGIEQITAVLAQHNEVASVHILSHGQPGRLYLGAAQLDRTTLDRYANRLQHWSRALAADADLMLYGCAVAAGDRGANLLQQLHQLTGANIAASANRTGNSALGGDWHLERQIGSVKSGSALLPATMAGYASVLEICIPNLLFAVDRRDIRVLDIRTAESASVGTLAFNTFALAREAETGLLYYIENTFNGRVAFWNPDTQENTIVGNTGVNTVFVKLAQSAPEVGGLIYGLDANSPNLYQINPDTGVATSLGAISGGSVPFSAGGGDMAFDPANPNRLFVTVTSPDVAARRYDLYVVDLTTRTATYIGDTGLEDEGSGVLAFGEDGQLYAGSESTLYRIDQTTAAPTRIGMFDILGSDGNPRNYNDFASLPIRTALVDISVTKTDGQNTIAPGNPIVYTVTVTNTTTDCDLNGITVNDLVSGTVTDVSWSAIISGNGGFPTPGDAGGRGNNITARVNLGANASVIYTIRGTIDAAALIGTTLENTVNVTVPPGIIDPDLDNNTGFDRTEIVPPGQGNPPIAENDAATTAPNTPVSINVLQNDRDPDNDPLTITGVTNGSNGTVQINRNATPNNPADDFAVYTPDRGFTGRDLFTYNISDGNGNTVTAQVTVTVRGGDAEDDCKPGINRMGTPGRNVLLGDDDMNRLRGMAGNDILRGFGCPDMLDGGRGNDRLYGGTASDTLQGRQNDDQLYGNSGPDRMNGGLGRDLLYGGIGHDRLRGGRGNDELYGGGGDDRMQGNRGFDRLLGNGGDDFLHGGQQRDRIAGNAGDDRLLGGLGFDRIRGGIGNDFINGGRGNDRMRGEAGDDRILGGQGRDLLRGGAGDDLLHGQLGNDTVRGGAGSDRLAGGLGADRLNGFEGDDIIFGHRGNDTLRGGTGDDQLIGGLGRDILIGGTGSDRFLYTRLSDRGDRVVDFDIAEDLIDLSRIFRGSRFSSSQPFEDYVQLVQQGADSIVRLDGNGDRPGGFQPFITLVGVTATNVSADRFVV